MPGPGRTGAGRPGAERGRAGRARGGAIGGPRGVLEAGRAAGPGRGRRAVAAGGLGGRRPAVAAPLQVPMVPYKLPQYDQWVWVDLWNALYRERIVILGKPVDDQYANVLIGTMLYLDSLDDRDVNMYINTKGGDIVPCLALHDTARHMKNDMCTVGIGACLGMMAYLLSVGEKGKRYSMVNTLLMLHLPSGMAQGQASDIWNETREVLRVRRYMVDTLSRASGQDSDKLYEDLMRNKYFTAQEAKDYGLIDHVLRPNQS